MVTLLATGPLYIIIGSALFLGERVSPARFVASMIGFAGAVAVSGVGAEGFTWLSLVPMAASLLWASTDVMTKYLAREEPAETLTLSLLVPITPKHLLILICVYGIAALLPGFLPAEFSSSSGYLLPTGAG